MEKNFFQTKAGGLTLCFIVIMVAFVLIMLGLNTGADILSSLGFLAILVAMLYSPVKVHILDRKPRS